MQRSCSIAVLAVLAAACGDYVKINAPGEGKTDAGSVPADGGPSSDGGASDVGPDCRDATCPAIAQICPPGQRPGIPPGQCCPGCVPDDCANVDCAMVACGPGYHYETPPGECCPHCVPDDCANVDCPMIKCAPGSRSETPPGECCPTCVPPGEGVDWCDSDGECVVAADARGCCFCPWGMTRKRALSNPCIVITYPDAAAKPLPEECKSDCGDEPVACDCAPATMAKCVDNACQGFWNEPPPPDCRPGDVTYYNCPDGRQVPGCKCSSDGSWVCVDVDPCTGTDPCAGVRCKAVACGPNEHVVVSAGECCGHCEPLDCDQAACPDIDCADGYYVGKVPGICCAVCLPASCMNVGCAMVPCGPFERVVVPPGECCPTCVLDCSAVGCAVPLCPPGSHPEVQPHDCCPQCVPDNNPDECTQGRAAAQDLLDHELRVMSACSVDADCTEFNPTTRCEASCGVAINKEYVEKARELVKVADDTYCAACIPAPIPCPAVMYRPRCDEKTKLCKLW